MSGPPHINKVLIDGANPGWIRDLKLLYNDEYVNYHQMDTDIVEKFIDMQVPIFCPISFNKYRKEMLRHSVKAIGKHMLRCNPTAFPKLIAALRTAKSTANDLDYSKKD